MVCVQDMVVSSDVFGVKIGENAYQTEEILDILFKHCPDFKAIASGDRIKKLSAKEISDGKGLLSKVYRLDLFFESSKSMDVVLKIPTGEIEMHVENENHDNPEFNAHSVECDVYELFRNYRLPGMPQVYYTEKGSTKKPGLIIMENLSNYYDTLTLSTSATVEQCWHLLRLIAKIQAHATSSNVPWKGRFKDKAHTDVFYDSFIATFLPLLLKEHPEFKPLVDQMDCITNKRFGKYALIDRPAELGATSFCQGDMWFNNIFIAAAPDGALTNTPKFIVDWQLVHEGNPMFDFSRFMTIASDADVRREVQPKAAAKFYEMLIEEHENLGNKGYRPPYSVEQLQELFDLAYLQQSALFLVGPPFTRVNPTNRNDSPDVLEAKIQKMKVRVRLNTEDAIKVIKKHGLDKRFGS